jgi:hypothetical protein
MTRSNSSRFGFVILTGAAALFSVGGCSVPKASDFKPSKLFSLGDDDDEPEKGIPLRMECTWTDTVLTKAGEKSQRGFGGRLMFYGKKEGKPILVEGQLVVYAFDEMNRAITDNKPTRRYVFPADQIALRMSKSEIGASYSFWLPWDEVGGPQTEVSLVCRFEPKGGGVITSEQTRHRLPGTMTNAPPAMTVDGRPLPPKLPEGVPSRPAQPTLESIQQARVHDPNLQLAGYAAPAMNQAAAITAGSANTAVHLDPQQQMTTTTIPLPQNYRLAMGTVTAGPALQQPAAAPQQLTQPQMQAIPIQQPLPQQPIPNPMVPAPQQVPAAMNSPNGLYPASLRPQLGAHQSQKPHAPTVASPALHLPSANGFGLAASAAMQPQPAMQPAAGQSAQVTGARMIPWHNVQTTTVPNAPADFAQQQPGGAPQTPQFITQPASQPMPPASGLTTSVSYPNSATALR